MIDTIFSPSFGNKPNTLIGRSQIMKELMDGLNSIKGSKERAMLITGNRGVGKTVLLLELNDMAKKNNYIVASPTIVSRGMLERIVEKIQDEGEEYLETNNKKLTGGSVGFLGFSAGLQFSKEEKESKSFAYKLDKLTKALNDKGLGVLILIDEVQANNEALKELIIAYQEMVGIGRNVSIAMAGLPGAISSTINDHVLTFLNRAKKIKVEPLKDIDIDAYFEKSFSDLGIYINDKQRKELVVKSQGSPYLVQLLGHYVTIYSTDKGIIEDSEYKKAVEYAIKDFEEDICETTLNNISQKDVEFLIAMANKGEIVKIKEILEYMGVKDDYAQLYKRRLIDSGIIEQVKRGEVRIAIPYIKDYLKNKY